MFTCSYTYLCTCIYMYVCMHKRIYIYMYIYIYLDKSVECISQSPTFNPKASLDASRAALKRVKEAPRAFLLKSPLLHMSYGQ